MKKNSFGWTKHLPNTRAPVCLKILPTHQHALPTIIILSSMGKIQLMVLQATSKESSSDIRNQEEKQSEWHKNYLNLQQQNWTQKKWKRADVYITRQGLNILKVSQEVR